MKKKAKNKPEAKQRPAKERKLSIFFKAKPKELIEASKKLQRAVAAAGEVPDFFNGVAFHTFVRRLAFHANDEKTGRYVFQKMHAVLSELESKRPVRKSELSRIVMMAYADLVFIVNGKFVTNLKDAKEYPTYSALTARVQEIMGITTHDEKLERNVRLIADDIGLEMTPWKGSKALQ